MHLYILFSRSPILRPDEFNTHSKNLNWNNYEIHRKVMKGDKEVDISREYIVLNTPTSRIDHNFKRRRCLFWQEQIPNMRQKLIRRCPMKGQKPIEKPEPLPEPASQAQYSTSSANNKSPLNCISKIIATTMISVALLY